MKRSTPNSAGLRSEEVAQRFRLARRVAREGPARHLLLLVDRAGEIRHGLTATGRDVSRVPEMRLEVVDLGQQRLGRALAREPLGQQRGGLGPKFGKWMRFPAAALLRHDTLDGCRRR